MKRAMYVGLAGAVVVGLLFSVVLAAQVKKDDKTGLDRISGSIQSVDKAKSSMVVRQQSGATFTIVFDANTKITKGTDAAAAADLKDGVRVICLGKVSEKDLKLKAERIDIRPPR